jgi:hypothetical protein
MRAHTPFFLRVRVLVPLASVAGVVVACSAGTNTHPSPPSAGTYEIEFPSTSAAVAADNVQAFVFANLSAAGKTDCAALIVARQSGADLPTPEGQTGQIALCDVLANGSKAEIPSVPYGDVSFLVVTQRNGVDYFTGCALATLADGSPPITVQLQQAVATLHIPSTDCASVSDFCASPPKCCVGCDGG